MILGFHGATTMTSDLETDLAAAAKAGFGALEVWADKIGVFLESHREEDLLPLFEKHGVKAMALNSLGFFAFQGDGYAGVLERCKQYCRWTQAIECPTMMVIPCPSPGMETSWDEIVEEHVRTLRELCAIAQDYGVRLAFEPLGFGWCTVRTPRGAAEIVEQAGCPNAGLSIDCAHFYAGGGALEELGNLDPAKIFAFHVDDLPDVPKEAVTDGHRVYPGEGVIPLDAIFEQVRACGYDGPCSVELFNESYWKQDPFEVAARARASALGVLRPFFEIA